MAMTNVYYVVAISGIIVKNEKGEITMNTCPNCGQEINDGDAFCVNCGTKFESNENYQNTTEADYYQNDNQYQQNNQYQQQQYGGAYNPNPMPVAVDIYDHTNEFDAKDISDNKVMAMALYLMGITGLFIALLAGLQSPYVTFHVKQIMKFYVVSILATIAAVILCWTVIVPFAYVILTIALFIIKIIGFFQVCNGKAKEPAIIRSIKFLK